MNSNKVGTLFNHNQTLFCIDCIISTDIKLYFIHNLLAIIINLLNIEALR